MRASVFIWPALVCAAALSFAAPAAATVAVSIDLTTQHMHVQSSGQTYDWPISSAREGYVTPDGTFSPQGMYAEYHSKKYDNAPMPHAIFFYYGFAIHGTNEVSHLGKPASHGCIRLSRANAATLFNLVKAEGASITITGAPAGQPLNPVVTQASASTGGGSNIFRTLFGN
ncbi:MAG: L,D-transpeptidase [Beijerinckiaceae bacterium]|nr:L,D-transpeptidase [Beijerinckiaceae bacterium]